MTTAINNRRNFGKFRVSVKKTLRHLYVQLINDKEGSTIVFASTNSKDFKKRSGMLYSWRNMKSAEILSVDFVNKVKQSSVYDKNIKERVFFDRGGYSYSGIVKLIGDKIREESILP